MLRGHWHYFPNRTIYGPVIEIIASVKYPDFVAAK